MNLATAREREAFAAGRAEGIGETLTLVETVSAVVPALIPPGVRSVSLAELADAVAHVDARALKILRPFDRREAITLKEAADLAGRSESALREWIDRYRIGRLVVGSVMVSTPALLALLDDDVMALAAYLAGDRTSSTVRPYFERAGLPIAA